MSNQAAPVNRRDDGFRISTAAQHDRSALIESLCAHLKTAGYVIYNDDAESGKTVEDESAPAWWFTWTQGRDIEAGETHHCFLDAAGDAMNHWFTNATIAVDGRI